jgi:uncharacterized membrane protein YjjP (DUF1212 family)
MSINPQLVLVIVGGVLLMLALLDIARHKRITPGAKGRLLTALIFALVLAWLNWPAR